VTLDNVSRLLIVLAACDWALTALLFIAARDLHEPALSERATTSVILSTVATIAALLGANRLGAIHVSGETSIALLTVALLLVSAPQFIWAIGLATGRFR